MRVDNTDTIFWLDQINDFEFKLKLLRTSLRIIMNIWDFKNWFDSNLNFNRDHFLQHIFPFRAVPCSYVHNRHINKIFHSCHNMWKQLHTYKHTQRSTKQLHIVCNFPLPLTTVKFPHVWCALYVHCTPSTGSETVHIWKIFYLESVGKMKA